VSERLQDFQLKVACAASTAKRLCNKAQGWTEGTTLGPGGAGAHNPNGVVANGHHKRLVFRPPGRNPVGVDGHRHPITQGWRGANPGLCSTTPLGLEFFHHVRAHPKPDGQSACKTGEFPKGIGAKCNDALTLYAPALHTL